MFATFLRLCRLRSNPATVFGIREEQRNKEGAPLAERALFGKVIA